MKEQWRGISLLGFVLIGIVQGRETFQIPFLIQDVKVEISMAVDKLRIFIIIC